MAYTLEEFCADCQRILLDDPGDGGREKVRQRLAALLENKEFVAATCGPDAEPGTHVIYRDPETDFHVLAHINEEGRTSPPHDHGSSWAIYGQAVEYTDMTEYDRTGESGEDGRDVVRKRRTYRLEPGMVGVFHPGDVHSIHFPDGARFVRVTGTDLTDVGQRAYRMERETA
jgi:predicted metal-dependent enzyme (double-stranded beta helix superfamily)